MNGDNFTFIWDDFFAPEMVADARVFLLACYLKAKAVRKPKVAFVSGIRVPLLPGQAIYGRMRASEDLQLSEKVLRRLMDVLASDGWLTRRNHGKCTVVTLKKWAKWERRRLELLDEKGQQGANRGPTQGHVLDGREEDKIPYRNVAPNPKAGRLGRVRPEKGAPLAPPRRGGGRVGPIRKSDPLKNVVRIEDALAPLLRQVEYEELARDQLDGKADCYRRNGKAALEGEGN